MSTNGKTPPWAQDHGPLLFLAQSAPMPVQLLVEIISRLPEQGEIILGIVAGYKPGKGKSIGDTLNDRLDELIFIAKVGIASLDWLIPYLVDKPAELANGMLDFILKFIDAISASSVLGKKIADLREVQT